jgi:hypothetical protein
MTDEKPKPEVLKVLDEFARKQGYPDWEISKHIRNRAISESRWQETLATLAYEQGKLDLLPKIEAIEAIIEKTHDIGQVAVELYRLKSHLSKSKGAK